MPRTLLRRARSVKLPSQSPLGKSHEPYRRQGAAVEKYLTHGRLVAVVGRLTSSVWRDGVNNRRHHVFVTAHSVDFLDKPTSNGHE